MAKERVTVKKEVPAHYEDASRNIRDGVARTNLPERWLIPSGGFRFPISSFELLSLFWWGFYVEGMSPLSKVMKLSCSLEVYPQEVQRNNKKVFHQGITFGTQGNKALYSHTGKFAIVFPSIRETCFPPPSGRPPVAPLFSFLLGFFLIQHL